MGYNQVPENRLPYIQANIKRLMKEKGFRQQDLADEADLSVETIKKIFRTKTAVAPSFYTLNCVAAALGTTYEALLLADATQMLSDERIAKIVLDEHNLQEAISKSSYANKFQTALLENGYDDILVFVNYLQFLGYELAFTPIKISALTTAEKEKSDCEFRKKLKEKQRKLQDIENMTIRTNRMNYKYNLTIDEVVKELYRLSQLDTAYQKEALRQLNINVRLSGYNLQDDKIIPFPEFYKLCDAFNTDIHHKIQEFK